MNRVLTIFAISLIAGILLPDDFIPFAVVILMLFSVYLICYLKFKRHFLLGVILGIELGMILSMTAPKYNSGIIHKYEGQQIGCTLSVNGNLQTTGKYTKFEAVVESVDGVPTQEKVLVYVYGAKNIDVNQKIVFDKIKFKRPENQRNFGSFDYRKYLTGKGIFFTATANYENIVSSGYGQKTILSVAREINQKTEGLIDKYFSDKSGGVFKALLLGNKSDVDDDVLDYYRDSGLSHVMAVSGMHLAILVMLLSVFTRYIGRWGCFVFSLVTVMAFVFITGMPVSVIRAAVMLLGLQLADALFYENDSLTNLALAVLIVLIPNPNAIYDISFVMSFSATLGILCLSSKIRTLIPKGVPDTIKGCICVTVAAQIGTLPFSALYFGQLSPLSVISNLLVVVLLPLIYLLGIPALITGLKLFIIPAEFVLSALTDWASFCSRLPGQIQYIPINNVVLTGLFLFSIIAMFVFSIKNRKLASVILSVPLLISIVGGIWETKQVSGTEITFLNVGQADSALLRTKYTTLLIDTATEYMGDAEVSGYLLRKGITKLDGVFVSHLDTDHCGGLIKVLDRLNTDAIYIPDISCVDEKLYKIIKYANDNDIDVILLKKNDAIRFSDITVNVLNPMTEDMDKNKNDSSLVFRADNDDVSVLFPGDLVEDKELENFDTDILKVSHHGSKNGSSEEFLAGNTPKIAVISLAENNSYGFPHPYLMTRLAKHTNEIYRTDLNKTVIIKCKNKNYDVNTMK